MILLLLFLFISSPVYASSIEKSSANDLECTNCIGGAEIDESTLSGVGGGAPTDANYLVGTANGSLSAEIAVGTTPGGDLGNTWTDPSVDNDSHDHTSTTLSGIDISADTNLIAGDALTLTDDDIDLDGTLADLTHRLHHIKGKHRDYNAFFANCIYDTPIKWTIDLLNIVKKHGDILILSGRSDEVKKMTEAWLSQNEIYYDYLIMRPEANYSPDEIIKPRMLFDFIKDSDYEVQFIIDDRQKVVDAWRLRGYNVLQCNYWSE